MLKRVIEIILCIIFMIAVAGMDYWEYLVTGIMP